MGAKGSAIQSLHKTLQLMVMYQSIKFGCKRISSSVDMVETVISDCMSPHYALNHEESKPIFSPHILALDDASPYQVWSQKVQQYRRYYLEKQ